MIVSLKWLKELVDITMDTKEFGDIMTMAGTKVETITPVSKCVKGIFTGKIVKIEKHPNADKLSVCTLDMGETIGEKIIITSATNVFEGAIIPVALDGAVIGNGTEMRKSGFRGVMSDGMMCSVEEMGMNKSLFSKEICEGIYIFPETVRLGEDVRELMWVDDEIIDFEITANRADCQSVYGIAKEAAAALSKRIAPLQLYDQATETGNDINDLLSVCVESDLCARYIAKMFKVKKIEPSPLWMQAKLLNSGVRPINNIVDVTNYVMLECGQPLHAFDYKSIGTNKIVVRQTDAKTVVTLDDTERAIDETMLMITNGDAPIAIAGIMGGANSEITSETEYVVLESACFDKTSIRLSSKKLGMRTEASARYEKGLYPNLTMIAAMRATYLLKSIGACEVISGIEDIYPNPTKPVSVDVDCGWINHFLGLDLSVDTIVEILERLFLTVERVGDTQLCVHIPDDRQDLRIPEDIAEDVARIYGYNRLPATIMGGTTFVGSKTPEQKFTDTVKAFMVGMGFYETLTTSFAGSKTYENSQCGIGEDQVVIRNPLGEDSSLMRNNLASQQLELIALNDNRNNPEGRFFEIAKTYHKPLTKGELPFEIKHLVMSAYGKDEDYFTLKGVVEMLFDAIGISNVAFTAGGCQMFHPGRKAIITLGEVTIGEIGEVDPMVVKRMGLPKRVYICELNFDALVEARNEVIHFEELPKYPGSTRDIAILLNESVPAAEIEKSILSENTGIIERVSLFDVYQGKQIPDGKKSLAYSIDFLHRERTLTDDDINPVMNKIISKLKATFDAELRI